MADIITTLSTNLFRVFIIKRFMSVYFHTDIEGKKKEKSAYFLFFVLTAFVYFVFHFPPANIITNLLLIWVITQLYEGGQKKKILVSLLIYGTNMFCDIIAVYSYNNYIVGKEYNEMVAYITVFLFSICEFMIERFLVKNRKEDFVPPYWNILLVIPIISIILLLILIMNNLNNRFILISVSAGILFINLLVFYLYDILLGAYLKLNESALLERQISSYSNQLAVLMQSEEKVKGLRHDMKHHIIELLTMAERHGNDEIKNYIQNMHTFLDNPQEYISSGNKEIDSLLNYMLIKAKNILKRVDYNINVPEKMEICLFDLNVVIGNLLDNAIYAASFSKEKWLEIYISYEKGMLFIRIRNSFDNLIQKQEKKYITTKKENREHGIGLQNVKKVVNGYKGTVQITDKDNIFDVKIILYTLLMK